MHIIISEQLPLTSVATFIVFAYRFHKLPSHGDNDKRQYILWTWIMPRQN